MSKAGTGRKTLISEGIILQLEAFLMNGSTVKDACVMVGFTEQSYYRWHKLSEALEADEDILEADEINGLPPKPIRADGETAKAFKRRLADYEATIALYRQFSQRMAKAQAVYKTGLIATVSTASDDDPKLALEILARRYPDEWGKRKLYDGEHGEQNVIITIVNEESPHDE